MNYGMNGMGPGTQASSMQMSSTVTKGFGPK